MTELPLDHGFPAFPSPDALTFYGRTFYLHICIYSFTTFHIGQITCPVHLFQTCSPTISILCIRALFPFLDFDAMTAMRASSPMPEMESEDTTTFVPSA